MITATFKVCYEHGIYDRCCVVSAENAHNDELNAAAAIEAVKRERHIKDGDRGFIPVSVDEYIPRWRSWVTIWEAPPTDD